jgi:hypothetical protein
VAAFIFNEIGLSKRAIGDYLGEKYKEILKKLNLYFTIS